MTGRVDDRTIAKYKVEAKKHKRDSWYLAFIMDTGSDERNRGKTVNLGEASFELSNKRFTMLDAPGHKNYIKNMISGACFADIAVLLVSARRGEFEAGFMKGGQTKEHALLMRTFGVSKIIIAVNKMDDGSVLWDKVRYDTIVESVKKFLTKKIHFKSKNLHFIPISGLSGENIQDPYHKSKWYKGPSLIGLLNNIDLKTRTRTGPLRIMSSSCRMINGVFECNGKILYGMLSVNDELCVVPTQGSPIVCTKITIDRKVVKTAMAGERVRLELKGLTKLLSGSLICGLVQPCKECKSFIAELQIKQLLPSTVFSSGYLCMLHVHSNTVRCQISKLIKVGNNSKPVFARKNDICEVRIKVAESIAVEVFREFSTLGRFTLRNQDLTVAVGKITRVV